ncbi:hypothetical protein BJ508DRAFT_361012 [Ascobolus immersus RN42]|uniref:Uncharacterized protein n=1 Tax=Ascobolus immersus RN42 TaxID=1160509 RepID=A0A3N4I9P1_ASCIM|nr:hypothetical protein BJ508DRAFT_361012 [Ascobolus immersus RN42]
MTSKSAEGTTSVSTELDNNTAILLTYLLINKHARPKGTVMAEKIGKLLGKNVNANILKNAVQRGLGKHRKTLESKGIDVAGLLAEYDDSSDLAKNEGTEKEDELEEDGKKASPRIAKKGKAVAPKRKAAGSEGPSAKKKGKTIAKTGKLTGEVSGEENWGEFGGDSAVLKSTGQNQVEDNGVPANEEY